MEVNEVKDQKRKLCLRLEELLVKFEKESGCTIKNINIDRMFELGGSQGGNISNIDLDVFIIC